MRGDDLRSCALIRGGKVSAEFYRWACPYTLKMPVDTLPKHIKILSLFPISLDSWQLEAEAVTRLGCLV